MEVETIDLEPMEIFHIENDTEQGEITPVSVGAEFTKNFKSLRHTEQLRAIQKLRASFQIATCPLVYNPGCSFAFNLASKINSINFNAFKEKETSIGDLLVMGNAVLRVYQDCDSRQWLQHIINKIHQPDSEPTEHVEKFYNKIWNMKKEYNFPSTIVELIVESYPAVLEDLVIDVVTTCSEIDQETLKTHLSNVLQNDDVKTWVHLSSRSPQVFQTSVSIIQTLLHFSRGNRKVLAFAQMFHEEVKNHCDLLHQLYPDHLRSIVSKLDVGPVGEDDKVLNKLSHLMLYERTACQCLLTFFPKWLPRLLVFTAKNGEATIISNEFGEWHA